MTELPLSNITGGPGHDGAPALNLENSAGAAAVSQDLDPLYLTTAGSPQKSSLSNVGHPPTVTTVPTLPTTTKDNSSSSSSKPPVPNYISSSTQIRLAHSCLEGRTPQKLLFFLFKNHVGYACQLEDFLDVSSGNLSRFFRKFLDLGVVVEADPQKDKDAKILENFMLFCQDHCECTGAEHKKQVRIFKLSPSAGAFLQKHQDLLFLGIDEGFRRHVLAWRQKMRTAKRKTVHMDAMEAKKRAFQMKKKKEMIVRMRRFESDPAVRGRPKHSPGRGKYR